MAAEKKPRKTDHVYINIVHTNITSHDNNLLSLDWFKAKKSELEELKLLKMSAQYSTKEEMKNQLGDKLKKRVNYLYRQLQEINNNSYIQHMFIVPIGKNILKDNIENEVANFLAEEGTLISDYKVKVSDYL